MANVTLRQRPLSSWEVPRPGEAGWIESETPYTEAGKWEYDEAGNPIAQSGVGVPQRGALDRLDEGDAFTNDAQVLQSGAQSVDDKMGENIKEKRRATRQIALQALGAALTTFASKDPGRTAAMFVEQQMANKQRQREMAQNEEMLQTRLAQTRDENRLDRESRAESQERQQNFTGEQQTERIAAGAAENVKDREFRTGEREARQGFELTVLDRNELHDRGMSNMRYMQQEKLQGGRISAAQDQALETQKFELYSETMSHAMALGYNPIDADRIGQTAMQSYSGQLPTDGVDADTRRVMDSFATRNRTMNDLKMAGSHAETLSKITEMSMDASGNVNPELFNANLEKAFAHSAADTSGGQNPNQASLKVLNDTVARARGGEVISPDDQFAAAMALQEAGGTPDDFAELHMTLTGQGARDVEDEPETDEQALARQYPNFDSMEPFEQTQARGRIQQDRVIRDLWGNFTAGLGAGPQHQPGAGR